MLVEALGNASGLAPHSLRRGGATFCLEAGMDKEVGVQLQGDWAGETYIICLMLTDRLKRKNLAKIEREGRKRLGLAKP